jgi:GNAT superfamily N-acetyltransferase
MRCWRYCASVSEVTVTTASADDVRAIARRRGFDEAAFRMALELADRGTAWVAHDASEVIGIAIEHASEEERYVGDLYVEPSYRGQGIGGRLLTEAFAGAGDAARAMLLEPAEPAGYALATRLGLGVHASLVRLAGAIPREEDLARMAAGEYRFQVDALDAETHPFGLNTLDREVRGTTRAADHSYFLRYATGQAFFLSGELVAYAYVWPDGHIGPMACVSQSYLVQIFAYALVTLQRRHGASWCTMLVPGSNVRIARVALRAGLRVEQAFLLASDSPHAEVSTYLGYHRLLF